MDNSDKLEPDPDKPSMPLLMRYFSDKSLQITQPEHVNNLYEKIHEYNDYIINKMYEAKSIEEYRIYQTIFNITMKTDAQTDMFTINITDETGTETRVAETYAEYLYYSDRILYDILNSLESSEMNNTIEHILFKINEMMTSLQYTYIINDSNNPLFTSIVKLLRFFKSYTVDLTSFNIVYLFDSKYYNAIKLATDIKTISKVIEPDDSMKQLYADNITTIGASITGSPDIFTMLDKYKYYLRINLTDRYGEPVSEAKIDDYLYSMIMTSILHDDSFRNNVYDVSHNIVKDVNIHGGMVLFDKFISHIYFTHKDDARYADLIKSIDKIINVSTELSVKEKIMTIANALSINEKMIEKDDLLVSLLMKINKNMKLIESAHIQSSIEKADIIDYSYSESNKYNSDLYLRNNLYGKDTLFIIRDE